MINIRLYSVKARHIKLLKSLLCLFLINFISACDNGTGNDQNTSGSASFQIQWPEDDTSGVTASQWIISADDEESAETGIMAANVTVSDDCSSRQITKVAVEVRDAAENLLVAKKFDCDLGVGKISVPVGSGRLFSIFGLDDDGNVRYYGGKNDVTIRAGSNDIGVIQMERSPTFCTDNDGDGYYAENDCGTAIDCNDNDKNIHPDAIEICGDGIDQDCDGRDAVCDPDPNDMDNDGDGYTENQGDCNDNDKNIDPGATEICGDGIDNDCDGEKDEDCGTLNTYYLDADGDGYGDSAQSTEDTSRPSGYVSNNDDCDDSDDTINPHAEEVCNDGKDNDCDGDVDEGGVCDDIVYFPDSNLEAVIREAINKPTGDIIASDIEGLLYLNADSRGILNIEGLQYATSLYGLYLRTNQITDISALVNLTSLQSLALNENQISDISPLANLTHLTYLNLNTNQISDISALVNLTSLEGLGLNTNQISDISALVNLTSLETLFLNTNQISDISALVNLTSLEWLGLHTNQISDISALVNLTNLAHLYLYRNQISDIRPLVDNNGIGSGDEVALHENPLNTASCFQHLPTLYSTRGVHVSFDCR